MPENLRVCNLKTAVKSLTYLNIDLPKHLSNTLSHSPGSCSSKTTYTAWESFGELLCWMSVTVVTKGSTIKYLPPLRALPKCLQYEFKWCFPNNVRHHACWRGVFSLAHECRGPGQVVVVGGICAISLHHSAVPPGTYLSTSIYPNPLIYLSPSIVYCPSI